MRKGGLEPPWVSPPDPKSGASANSATFARQAAWSTGPLPLSVADSRSVAECRGERRWEGNHRDTQGRWVSPG